MAGFDAPDGPPIAAGLAAPPPAPAPMLAGAAAGGAAAAGGFVFEAVGVAVSPPPPQPTKLKSEAPTKAMAMKRRIHHLKKESRVLGPFAMFKLWPCHNLELAASKSKREFARVPFKGSSSGRKTPVIMPMLAS